MEPNRITTTTAITASRNDVPSVRQSASEDPKCADGSLNIGKTFEQIKIFIARCW